MKTARLLPLAFMADVHGLILLMPYLVVFLTVARIREMRNLKLAIQIKCA